MINKKASIFLLISFTILISVKTFSQDGQLDPNFGQGGIVTTAINIADENNVPYSIAIQSDEKIVVAGFWELGNRYVFAVVRYNQNGSLDNTFGINGIVTTPIGDSDDRAYSVAIQSDGKIVAAGYSNNGSTYDFAIVRYLSNGNLDNTFGADGIVITPVGVSTDFAYNRVRSVKIQSDGKIVAAGVSYNGDDYDFAIARYNQNGTLDNTFGTDGVVTTDLGDDDDYAYSVVIQSDGKIIAAGRSGQVNIGSDNDFAIVRYNQNGVLDNTFGSNGNGIVITQTGSPSNIFLSVAIQSDEKIVAAGFSGSVADYDFTIARFNSDGIIDNSFGKNQDGIVITEVGPSISFATSITVQSDGKIVAAGSSGGDLTTGYLTAVRYNSNGDIDSAFGTNGITVTPVNTSNGIVNSAAIQSDGKIVAAGYSNNGSTNDFAVVRCDTNGDLDNTFGTGGIVTTPIGYSISVAQAVKIQNDGKIVVAGPSSGIGNDYDFALARYNTDGSLDNTFGTNGIVTTQIGTSTDIVYSVAIQSDGKIVASGGSIITGSSNFAIVRYHPNGNLDNTFGNDGVVTTDIGTTDIAYSVAIQSDGKIIALGRTGSADFAIVRYLSNGNLDNTFGVGGIVITQVGMYSIAYSVAIQSDGKIVASGKSHNGNDYDLAMVRYNENGIRDDSFGTDGIVITPIEMEDGASWSTVIQSDGKIIAAGNSHNGSNYDFCVVRYNTDGSLDDTFGMGGIIATPIGESTNEYARSVAIQTSGGADEKIVVSGFTNNGVSSFATVRYNMDGSLDNNFGKNGIVTTPPFGTSSNEVYSVAIQTNGDIVVAGAFYSLNYNYYRVFSVARYIGSTPTGISEENAGEIPGNYALLQNYPNPFNPSTKISWQSPVSSHQSLKIYDVLGNEVAILVDEYRTAGNYEIEFDASGLSSGIYFYRLSAGNFNETKKLILMK